jgi:hypothetical protein
MTAHLDGVFDWQSSNQNNNKSINMRGIMTKNGEHVKLVLMLARSQPANSSSGQHRLRCSRKDYLPTAGPLLC